ncbi:MAG: hypothetical protein MPL62_14785, partial [Alphaproteobacteria bacterium]|nr:hypothetical protein [Alphaproteobacteria bacterium]
DENLHYALIKEFNKYIKSKLANSIYDHDYRILDIIISYVVGISKYLHIDISNTINILERSDNVDLNILAKTKYKVKCLEIYSEIIKYSLKKAQNLGDVEAEKLISDLINSIQCVEILPKTYDWSRVDHPTGNSD